MQNVPTLEQSWRHWALAAGVLVGATAFNFALQPLAGGKIPWLIYFPALVFTALYAGLGPALVVLAGSLLAVLTFWMGTLGAPWAIRSTSDQVSAVMFLVAGTAVAAVSAFTRKLLRRSRNDKLRLDIALEMGNMYAWNWDIASGALLFSANATPLVGTLGMRIDQIWTLVHPEDVPRTKGIVESALREGTEYSFLSRMYGQDSQLRWVHTRGHVHRDADGRAVYVSGVSADVTELASAQEQLRLESQRKDTFLATLAHELRNPLAPIRYATAMLGENASPAQRQKAREVVVRQSAHMARLLDDLLDMSRISRDVIELQLEVFDLRIAIEQAVENVRSSYASRGHLLAVSLPPGPVPVEGDLTRVQQVLGNLLDNAAKYTPDGGHVQLRLAALDGEAVVCVADDGIGMEPDEQPHVFELFTQLQGPGRSSGLGIGLAIVRRLVELHRGTITVESAGRGRGSNFTVRFPLCPQAADIRPLEDPTVRTALSTHAGAILVVDDNVDAAQALAAFLNSSGFSVHVAHAGQAALAAAHESRPAAVVLDLGLPDMSGLDVARRIRRDSAETVLIAVTGWGQLRDETAAAGFDLHLVKPVDPLELQQSLGALLSRPGKNSTR